MRKLILHLGVVISLSLSFETTAQTSTTPSGTLHHTAAQPAAGATNKLRIQSNMDVAKFIEEALNVSRQTAEAKVETGLPKDFHYKTKEWTQQDITAFAKSAKTFEFFENLLGIGNAAVATDNAGKYAPNAMEAQAALTYLKPDGCKSWKGFCNMIANAADETETLRVQYHKDLEVEKRGGKP